METLAAAVAGMYKYTELHKRCIVYSVHLKHEKYHDQICRDMFGAAEDFVASLDMVRKGVSYCGLLSFLDVNGSKFTAADRDPALVHCHGSIFIPHGINEDDRNKLIERLKHRISFSQGVRSCQAASEIRNFENEEHKANLLDMIKYDQKEATRIETFGNFGTILPWDIRSEYKSAETLKIEKRQEQVLNMLRGPDRFKIWREQKVVKN